MIALILSYMDFTNLKQYSKMFIDQIKKYFVSNFYLSSQGTRCFFVYCDFMFL